jgi:osmoprotectant transport system permease protein
MSLLAESWDFYRGNREFVEGAVAEHVRLTLTALGLAAVTGVVLGVVAARLGRTPSFGVVALGNLGRTVPTFAVIGIVLTLLSVGFWSAVIGLYALAVPPIMLNTLTGIRGVEAGTIEASRGMGFTPLQILTRVQLPIALPLISAGVRTAAVEVVATATLAGLVAAGGLGTVVISGLDTGQDDVLLAGAIPLALLALAAQGVFGGLERLVTPRGLRLTRSLSINEGRTR